MDGGGGMLAPATGGAAGRPRKQEIELTETARVSLSNLVRSRTAPQGLVRRARIVLASAEGASNTAIAPEDVRDVQCWAGQGRDALRRRLGLSGFSWAANVAWTADGAGSRCDHAGGDACVARRGIEPVITEQRLDDADVGAALQEVGREAVAQRVRRSGGRGSAAGGLP